MKHLVNSFKKHTGCRGVHFYDEDSCTFLSWKDVFHFIKELPSNDREGEFTDRLADSLANYDPDREFLAVQQHGRSISVELYSGLG